METIVYEKFTGKQHRFNIFRERGVYYLYLDDNFYCSNDSLREAEDEIEEAVKEHNYSWFKPF